MNRPVISLLCLCLIVFPVACSPSGPASTATPTPPSKSSLSPADIPRKPASLTASESEYFLIYTTYKNWNWDFTSRYESLSQKYLADNSTSWWMGSTENESKRLSFTRNGNRWKIKSLPPLPSGTPTRPSSLGGSDADYYFILSLYEGWYGKGSFSEDFAKGTDSAATNNWVTFWIGSGEDISKRTYFFRSGNEWTPRAFVSTLLDAVNYTGQYPEPVNISYTDTSGGQLTVQAYPGQIEVFFKESITPAAAQSLIKAKNGTVLGKMPAIGYYLVGISPGSEDTFIKAMLSDAGVASAAPNMPVSASQEGVTINTDFINSPKPVPLNVKPGIIALDYYVNHNHGRYVNDAIIKNGGTLGSSIEISTSPGNTSSDKVKMAIIAAAEGNHVFNPGEPTLFNLSSNHGVNKDFDILTIEHRQSVLNGWESFTRGIALGINALPSDIKDNVALVNSAGNTRMPLAVPLANLRKDPAVKDILDKYLLLVSTTLKGEQTDAYPWGEFSNLAPGDPDVAVMNNPEAADGTSFASPAAAAIIQQIRKSVGISLTDALKAAKLAVATNPKHELVLKEAIEKAKELKASAPPTSAVSPTTPPSPVPGPTTSPTPSPTSTTSSKAVVSIDSVTCNLLNSRYDSNGYYWVEIQASGTASGPAGAMIFLTGQAEPAASGWLPVSTPDWTILEKGRMAKRESNSSPAATSWSTSGKLPITWTQWHNFPNISFKLTVEIRQDEYSKPLASTSKNVPLQQPAQAR